MSEAKPPRRLPAGLRPAWELLRQADEETGSRQVLATRLGISTGTLQRLLVTGEIPRFRSGATTREVRSWTRTLTRLAVHFGRDPRGWVEAAGIRWDDEIATISGAAHEAFRRRAARSSRAVASKRRAEWPAAEVAEGEFALRIGIAEQGPFSRRLPILDASFLELFTRALIGAVAPAVRLSFEPAAGAPSRFHAVAGCPDTVRARRTGTSFIPLPGFRVHLAAARIVPAADGSSPHSWDQLLSPMLAGGQRVVTVKGSPAETFLLASCGWPGERILASDSEDPAAIASMLAAAAHPVMLVTDEEHLGRVARALHAQANPAPALRFDALVDAIEVAPAHPLAIALPAGARDWTELLALAVERELFGSSARVTARIYAAFLAALAFEATASDTAVVTRGRRLEMFEAAGDDFQDELARHFVHVLVAAPPVSLGPVVSSPSPPVPLAPAAARRAALARAASLIPGAWLPRFEHALGELQVADPQLCQSCSASIPHHRGVSDRYCRFCADEGGALRPRAEVERLLAGWLRSWEHGLSPDDARSGAVRFMAGMPAWSRN